MRGTMKENMDGSEFRDRLSLMINKIRERIEKRYAAARSMMAAKNLAGKVTGPAGSSSESKEKETKPKAPTKPVAPTQKKSALIKKVLEEKAEKVEKKYDGGSGKYNGKYPLTKFYGNQPVVVYYIPIIADTSGKGLEKLDEIPGTKALQKTIKEKLATLERKQ